MFRVPKDSRCLRIPVMFSSETSETILATCGFGALYCAGSAAARKNRATEEAHFIFVERRSSASKGNTAPAPYYFPPYVFVYLFRELYTVNDPSSRAVTLRYLPSHFSLRFAINVSGELPSFPPA